MMAKLLSGSRPVACKPHQCGYCERLITVGTRYLNQHMAGEGTAWTLKCYELCHRIFWRLHGEAGLYDDEMVGPVEIREALAAEEQKVT